MLNHTHKQSIYENIRFINVENYNDDIAKYLISPVAETDFARLN